MEPRLDKTSWNGAVADWHCTEDEGLVEVTHTQPSSPSGAPYRLANQHDHPVIPGSPLTKLKHC